MYTCIVYTCVDDEVLDGVRSWGFRGEVSNNITGDRVKIFRHKHIITSCLKVRGNRTNHQLPRRVFT